MTILIIIIMIRSHQTIVTSHVLKKFNMCKIVDAKH